MVPDAALDRENWLRRSLSGSSYEYFWRHPYLGPSGLTADELAEQINYQSAIVDGWAALVMDINAQPGCGYIGAFGPGERIESHPLLKKTNVGYIGGNIRAFGSDDLLMKAPGSTRLKVAWWAQANDLDEK